MRPDKRRNIAPDLSRKGQVRKEQEELLDREDFDVSKRKVEMVVNPKFVNYLRRLQNALQHLQVEKLEHINVVSLEGNAVNMSDSMLRSSISFILSQPKITKSAARKIIQQEKADEEREARKAAREKKRKLTAEEKLKKEREQIYGDDLGSF